MMDSIGTILREERERRELSIHDVFEYTKITEPNVEALERDRFESFPNKVYARAFLRDYSNFLNLDSAALLQRYENEWCTEVIVKSVEGPSISSKKSSWYYILPILVIILSAGGYYVWSEYYNDSKNPITDTPGVNNNVNVKDSAPVQPVLPPVNSSIPAANVDSNKTENTATTGTKPVKTVQPIIPQPDEISLSITAKYNVWIRVSADGKTLYQRELKAGQTKVWKAKNKFKVRSGMMNAVKVTLNGSEVKLKPISKSKVPIGEAEFTKANLAQPSIPTAN